MANLPSGLSDAHRVALEWFDVRTGQEIGWPEPLDGLFLLNKAKGIHKPSGWQHALSIRQSLDSPYSDSDPLTVDGGQWSYRYAEERIQPGSQSKSFTNDALMRNLEDGVPVAVVRQLKRKPGVRYRVLGLAKVVGWEDGFFELRSYAATTACDDLVQSAVSLEDARRRTQRAIIARQGGGAFRSAALSAFGGRCALTGYDVEQGLEAAHIVPYLGGHTNALSNTLLLRADLHTLFDRELLDIDPQTLRVSLCPQLKQSCLSSLDGVRVKLPGEPGAWQENLALRAQWLEGKGSNPTAESCHAPIG